MIFEMYVSQGSVVTQLRVGGIFNNHVIANFSPSVLVLNLSKCSIFGEDIDIS